MALLGNPFAANMTKKLSNDELIQALRVDIINEYEAIIGYEAHIMSTDNENVKKILSHISDEERRHIGQLQQLLYMINPKEAEYTEKGRQQIQQQQAQNFIAPLQ